MAIMKEPSPTPISEPSNFTSAQHNDTKNTIVDIMSPLFETPTADLATGAQEQQLLNVGLLETFENVSIRRGSLKDARK